MRDSRQWSFDKSPRPSVLARQACGPLSPHLACADIHLADEASIVFFSNQIEIAPFPLPPVPADRVPEHRYNASQAKCLFDLLRRSKCLPVSGVNGFELLVHGIELREVRMQSVEEVLEAQEGMAEV